MLIRLRRQKECEISDSGVAMHFRFGSKPIEKKGMHK